MSEGFMLHEPIGRRPSSFLSSRHQHDQLIFLLFI